MAIITIARQEGSLSKEITEGLAKRFGWQYVTKAVIAKEVPERYGVNADIISKYDEKKPGLFESFSNYHDKFNRYFELYFLEKVIADPNCILLGRGGAFFLRNVPGVFRIRVVGSKAIRIKRIMDLYSLDERSARKFMTEQDNNRAEYTRFFYNMSWDDADSYDLVINTDQLDMEVLYSMLERVIEIFNQKGYTEKLVQRLQELYLAQKITVCLMYEKKIPIHFLDVEVKGNVAVVMGTVEHGDLIGQVIDIVKSFDGIDQVENKMMSIKGYPSAE